MTKRRVIVRELEARGYKMQPNGRGGHDKFTKPGARNIMVPRHRELKDYTVEEIRKQAGLR